MLVSLVDDFDFLAQQLGLDSKDEITVGVVGGVAALDLQNGFIVAGVQRSETAILRQINVRQFGQIAGDRLQREETLTDGLGIANAGSAVQAHIADVNSHLGLEDGVREQLGSLLTGGSSAVGQGVALEHAGSSGRHG